MKLKHLTVSAAVMFAPGIVIAQGAPVADAFRDNEASEAKNLIAAAEDIPAAKYTYKPTPAQMSVADIQVHLAQGNDYLCGGIAGMKAPTRTEVKATAPKADLVARLKETFEFCNSALKSLDDSKLAEQVDFFGGKRTRASVMTLTTADWADHYSQIANYMRLNGMLPPTAKKPQP
jgi:uncharacterized damage-inducible protein DinB